jgi:hypothetical protein
VRHHSLQIELKRRPDRNDRQSLLQHLQDLQVVAHHEVGFPGEQQLHAVDLGTAHLESDVEAGLFIQTRRLGLIEAAMLGLSEPTGKERHLVGSRGCPAKHSACQESCGNGL